MKITKKTVTISLFALITAAPLAATDYLYFRACWTIGRTDGDCSYTINTAKECEFPGFRCNTTPSGSTGTTESYSATLVTGSDGYQECDENYYLVSSGVSVDSCT